MLLNQDLPQGKLNHFHATLYMVVFGCDDEGRIQEPTSPQEFLLAYKAKGVVFETEDYELAPNTRNWYFTKPPVIGHLPYHLLVQVLGFMY